MPEAATAVNPALKTKFISHATIEAADLNVSKQFFEEFLGFEVIWMSPHALCLRLGGKNAVVCVRTANRAKMSLANHNGVDVASRTDVDEAYARCQAEAETWGLHQITAPKDQHGNYSFYFWDRDNNCWEILHNPPGGYSDLFDNPKD